MMRWSIPPRPLASLSSPDTFNAALSSVPSAPGDTNVVYDASRLCTRVLNRTPNGIDRLDALLARAFFSGAHTASPASALVFGWGGPRLLPASEGLAALGRAETTWGEREDASGATAAMTMIALRLRDGGTSHGVAAGSARIVARRAGRAQRVVGSLLRLGLRKGASPQDAPNGAIYINATHFPLDWPSHTAWLDRREDVRLVMFVHDLLPLDRPDLFWRGEADRHRARLALLTRRGTAAIVTSNDVETRLRQEVVRSGRRDLRILRAHPPVDAIFWRRSEPDPLLAGRCYFVVCGTIEPRKNHRLLLRVWRRLIEEKGASAPMLVIVGKRGWLCEDIVADINDPALSRHVIEGSNLSSADYKRLLDNACALLAPSLAEGFGLPVAEALTAGVPVLASDIPPFREQGSTAMILIDPNDDALWHKAIQSLVDPRGGARAEALGRVTSYRPVSPAAYVRQIAAFIDGCG